MRTLCIVCAAAILYTLLVKLFGHPNAQHTVKQVQSSFERVRPSCRAVQIWEQAQHLLEAAGVKCESVVTTHAGHAIQEIASLDLELHACIIGVGGDGLVHEILQVPSRDSNNSQPMHASNSSANC